MKRMGRIQQQRGQESTSKTNKNHFTKEAVKVANRGMKMCSISLALRETQITSTGQYHRASIRAVKIKMEQ